MAVKHGLLHLGQTRRLRVVENRILSRIFGPKRDEDFTMRNFTVCTIHLIYLGILKWAENVSEWK